MNSSLDRLARDVANEIDEHLQRIGVLYRVFARAKSESSIEKKLEVKNYAAIGKKMQDIIGVRITMYFADDLKLVYNVLKSKFKFVDETIDKAEETVFKPTRINLIFRLDAEKSTEVRDTVVTRYKYIDTTYELQLRTVLSEGWHEVDHDLRYKCQEDWEQHSDIARAFNGVYASLETNDWSILAIFDNLAYRHYKNGNWEAMFRNKFRIRLSNNQLDKELVKILNSNSDLPKSFFRIDRHDFLNRIFKLGIKVPLTMSNMIYLLNGFYIGNSEIISHTPEFISSNKLVFPN